MTWTPPLWEPPFAGTEAEALLGALDRKRMTFRYKTDGLDAAGLAVTIGASSITLGGLLKHLAVVEDVYGSLKLDGGPLTGPWPELGHDQTNEWEFRTAASDSPEELYRLWDESVARNRAKVRGVIADGGLDQPVAAGIPDGIDANLRRILLDLLEEYGRHTGHADLLREAVDGRTGEDPDDDWVPPAAFAS